MTPPAGQSGLCHCRFLFYCEILSPPVPFLMSVDVCPCVSPSLDCAQMSFTALAVK